jgi:hypothetical protein
MAMSTVFVIQNQHRWDKDKSTFVPKFDFSSAVGYGQLSYLLTPTAAPFNSGPVIDELREKLSFFGDDDCLLLIGNPVLIGCAVAIAAQSNRGKVKVLQWSGTDRRYVKIQLDLLQKEM